MSSSTRADHRTPPTGPTPRQTALIAVGQGALMILGGVLALLVAQLFGKNPNTDAFFAAYGIYSVGLTFAQTVRLTGVPRMKDGAADRSITRLLGATFVLALLAFVPMVVLADPLAEALVEEDPEDVAPEALRILWIALTAQLLAATLATILAARGLFAPIGIATLCAGVVSVGTFLACEGAIGITAAAVGLTAGAVWLAALQLGALVHSGWRPSGDGSAGLRETAVEARVLVASAGTFIGSNLAYVITLGLASREGAGSATLYAYAFVGAVILTGVTSNVTAALRAPEVVAADDRLAQGVSLGAWSFRFTLLLATPVLLLVVLVGAPLVELVLGDAYTTDDAETLLITLACFGGWLVGYAAGLFAIIELLARGELRRLGALAVGQSAAVGALGGAASAVGGIALIAAALSAVQLLATLVQVRWAFGSVAGPALRSMCRDAARQTGVLVAATPAPVAVLLLTEGDVAKAAAAAVAAAGLIAASRLAWPRETRALVGVLRLG